MNSHVSFMRGSEDSGDKSLCLEASRLSSPTPAPRIIHKEKLEARKERGRKVPQGGSRQRRHKKEQRRRGDAHLTPCHLAQLPSELLLKVMHHMDKGSLKSFVLTSKQMHHLRDANAVAVFKGMQREQFPGYLSAFGDPQKISDEQVEETEIVARESDWWGDTPRPRYQDLRTLWWQHITDLAILEGNIDAEATALHNLAGGDKVDVTVARDAILLQWRLGLRMAQTCEEDGQQQAQMFLNHPVEVQHQLLEIAQFLRAKIENQVGLAAVAGCWARLEVHLPQVGSLEETRFVEWISARVTAHTLAVVFRCGPRGVGALLKCAKDSAEASQMRFELVELLVNDQAGAGEGGFDMGMMMGQKIGFHALTFASTKLQVESQLKFWRSQSADSHMNHLKHFLGIQEHNQ